MGIVALIKDYQQGNISGWMGEDYAEYEWKLLNKSPSFKKIQLQAKPNSSRRMMLFDITRAILGKDTHNYPRQIQDCGAFAAKDAAEYLQCINIFTKKTGTFKPVFVPYFHGIARSYSGLCKLGTQQGSLNVWMADSIVKYGFLPSFENGIPPYNSHIARAWGDPDGKIELDKAVKYAKLDLVKAAGKVLNWKYLVTAICNGYPVTIASNQGFKMKPDNKGFHRGRGKWGGHHLCIVGIDDECNEPHAILLNSIGDAHGILKDFVTKKELPVGTLRVEKALVENMIKNGEAFAFSNFQGFVTQELNKGLV